MAAVIIYLAVVIVFLNSQFAIGYHYDEGPVRTLTRCPGYYCGRHFIEDGNSTLWSACGSCPRGTRVNGSSSACIECNSTPTLYDWMYLAFMVLIGLLAQWYSIDVMTPSDKFSVRTFAVHISALVETLVSALVTLLIHQPYGLLSLKSCAVEQLSDWYTILHNPNPNYEKVLHCSQEAVFPLYSIIFVHYGLAVFMLLLIRPMVNRALNIRGHVASNPIYAALYLYPVLALVHGVMAGLIYYSFPSIIILLSLMSHAFHFASRTDQSWRVLLRETVLSAHNLMVVVGHWILHGFGLIALTMWLQPQLRAAILTLIPLPTVLYVLLSRFTDPGKFHSD